jgi:glycosyltransferase involved in cell wall biosynthesis
MIRHLAKDFEIHVFGSEYATAEYLPTGTGFHYYRLASGVSPFQDVLSVVRLRRMLRNLAPDVVHTYDTKPAALARIAARLAGVPVVIGTLPGLGSLYSDNRVTTRVMRWLYEAVQRFASSISSRTILQNNEDLEELVQRHVIDPERAQVVAGSGVDTTRFRPGRRKEAGVMQLRTELGAADSQLVVITIGRVMRAKGVLDLASAASALRMRRPGRYVFVLIGSAVDSGQEALSERELATVRQDLNWLGERRDVGDLLAAADIFALPTYYREGIPRALLEAAASGLGLIATDMPGCREVVLEGQTGLLIPIRDPAALAQAIERFDDPALCARLAGEARRLVVRRFGVEIICDELTDLYRSLSDTHTETRSR